uniref:VHS domain-containing protein n=1 Tax=viral metagenome TaxID=1070528 RepID=A0A6H1ZW18_9ZZZZ
MLNNFSIDEVTMMRFLQICVPSLDPDSWQNVLDACQSLCTARPRLNKNSVLKCLKQIFGDDYEEPVFLDERSSCGRKDGDL